MKRFTIEIQSRLVINSLSDEELIAEVLDRELQDRITKKESPNKINLKRLICELEGIYTYKSNEELIEIIKEKYLE